MEAAKGEEGDSETVLRRLLALNLCLPAKSDKHSFLEIFSFKLNPFSVNICVDIKAPFK